MRCWQKRALGMGALAAVALLGPACMGHTNATYGTYGTYGSSGTGGAGTPVERCEVFHPEDYSQNHPNMQAPAQGSLVNDNSAICR